MTLRALVARACALAVVIAPAGVRAQETCRDMIPPELASSLFEQIKGPAGADGCTLAGASTERWRMDVRWEQAGRALPPARVAAIACAREPRAEGGVVALSAPEDLVRACPDAVGKLEAAVRATAVPTVRARPEAGPWPRHVAVAAWAAVTTVLLAAAAVACLVLRRGVD